MSKKLYRKLYEDLFEEIEQVKLLTNQMEMASNARDWNKWDSANKNRACVLESIMNELDAAYHATLFDSIVRQGKKKFWELVNNYVNE